MTDHLGPDSKVSGSSPEWSVMVPSYLPNEFLKDALVSVLAAIDLAGVEAQVEVVDDGSPGMDLRRLLDSWGLQRVDVHRRPVNGGLGECWNTCIERSTGALIHILHQDDLVHPMFYARMTEANVRFPSATMLFCRTEILEQSRRWLAPLQQAEAGLLPDWLATLCAKQVVHCPAVVVRSQTYEAVGSFDPSLKYIIDWEMWIRIAAAGPVAYLPEPLVSYRMHAGSESGRLQGEGGRIMDDFATGIKKIRRTLVSVGRPDCVKLAVNYACEVSGGLTWEHEAAGKPRVAARELWLSFRHFWWGMRPALMLRHLRRYLGLRWRALR